MRCWTLYMMCRIYDQTQFIGSETHTKRPPNHPHQPKSSTRSTSNPRNSQVAKLGQDPSVKDKLKLRLLMLCEATWSGWLGCHQHLCTWSRPGGKSASNILEFAASNIVNRLHGFKPAKRLVSCICAYTRPLAS